MGRRYNQSADPQQLPSAQWRGLLFRQMLRRIGVLSLLVSWCCAGGAFAVELSTTKQQLLAEAAHTGATVAISEQAALAVFEQVPSPVAADLAPTSADAPLSKNAAVSLPGAVDAMSGSSAFKLMPRLCLHPVKRDCPLTLHVQWQRANHACLYQKNQPKALLCGAKVTEQLQLTLSEHTRFELRDAHSGQLLDSRLVRVLGVDLNAGDQLLKRSRASWGNP